jgi:hypothetical protein
MESKFQRYMRQLARAKELVEAREEPLHKIVREVLEGVGVPAGRLHLTHISDCGETVYVAYEWLRRGLVSGDDRELPKRLFEAEDPGLAAREYHKVQQEEEAAAERRSKMKQLRKLQEELNA